MHFAHRFLFRALLIAAGLLTLVSCSREPDLSSAAPADTAPRIDPDYASLVIPPNVAPLNFRVLEEGRDCVVRISSDGAAPVQIHCPGRICRMEPGAWRELLQKNKGKNLYYDVYVRKADGAWTRFRRITNSVAEEPIDSHIVYRLVAVNNHFTETRGVFQRNLETFETSTLITGRNGTFQCFNCHTFCQNDPNRFFFHLRGKNGGTVFVSGGKIRKVNTQTAPLWRPLAFASWHPDGVHIAATVNQYRASFVSSSKVQDFEAIEKRGNLVVYNVETNSLSTTRQLFDNEYIYTHPAWSADGKYIYCPRCPDKPLRVLKDFDEFRSDLVRVPYDAATETLGAPEMVMECSKLNKSCAFPNPSPDGRYILLVLSDKTTYPIFQPSSDLYLLDLQSHQCRRLDSANSDRAESFPRWSSSGRWFSFVSTRRDGLHALPYFAYFDADGRDHKAFLLPQEDPAFYDAFIESYNVVELVKSKVTVDPFKLAEAMQQPAEPALFPHPPQVDAYTGATRLAR